ncbi:cytochrome P450 18a1-like [Argiope bruennichi]|uniref:cytochrome P450 18a1-like n=1 Tax=Argiope bruennichi TaxID=94029 RepID=UPI002493D7C0|nr:cytochrome P450 18a1-like [Argiope bruennichi]
MKISVEKLTLLVKTHQYEIFLGLCALFLAYVIALVIKKFRSNLPPGPMGLPIIGYLPFLTKELHLDFMKLGQKYGDVFSVRLGSQDIVILHGGDAIKEGFNKPELLGRPPNCALEKFSPQSAFFSSHFHLWKEQRRFVVQSMKDLGLGKTKIEEAVMDEINHFMDVLRSYKGQPIDVKEPLSPSMSNNICALVFGKRFEYDDPERQFLDKNIDEIFEYFSQISLDVVFPWLYYVPFVSKLIKSDKSRIAFQNYKRFFQKELTEHLKTFDPSHARDFIDRYLIEIEIQRAKNPNTTFNHNMLMNNAIDLFDAGSETVRTSIHWFIYVMAAFPDVQKKVQKEIMEVIGSEKTPEYMDMRNMPYTHAVMLEIMRWKTIVALNLVHYALEDATVGGYTIPKGTTVIANFWAVHHDPRYWDEPEEFKPERFLSKDGKSVVKQSYFMPFSLGRRVCPGESMAYLEMFLYFTSILREFDIVFPDGTKPTFDAKYIVTYRLDPYLVRFIPKN